MYKHGVPLPFTVTNKSTLSEVIMCLTGVGDTNGLSLWPKEKFAVARQKRRERVHLSIKLLQAIIFLLKAHSSIPY
jgi:hypothetical protein